MKKNILTTLVACILVAALAVGGTLAYMTATDSKVTNTFTFANGMAVDIYEKLSEAVVNKGQAEVTGTANDGGLITGEDIKNGLNYTNVTPGQTLNKAPRVAVKTTVDAYVFVKPTAGANVTIGTIGWTQVGTTGVYYKLIELGKTDNGITAVAGQSDVYTIDTPIFTTVTIGNVTGGTIGNVEIEVSMIQAAGFNGDAAAAFAQAPAFQSTAATNP